MVWQLLLYDLEGNTTCQIFWNIFFPTFKIGLLTALGSSVPIGKEVSVFLVLFDFCGK